MVELETGLGCLVSSVGGAETMGAMPGHDCCWLFSSSDPVPYTMFGVWAVSAGLSGRGKLIAVWPSVGSHVLRDGETCPDGYFWDRRFLVASYCNTVSAD